MTTEDVLEIEVTLPNYRERINQGLAFEEVSYIMPSSKVSPRGFILHDVISRWITLNILQWTDDTTHIALKSKHKN